MLCSENTEHRQAGIIRTDLIRRMMNPLDETLDLHTSLTTSRYRQFLNVPTDRPPEVRPGPLVTSLKTGWNFG